MFSKLVSLLTTSCSKNIKELEQKVNALEQERDILKHEHAEEKKRLNAEHIVYVSTLTENIELIERNIQVSRELTECKRQNIHLRFELRNTKERAKTLGKRARRWKQIAAVEEPYVYEELDGENEDEPDHKKKRKA